LNIKSCEKKEKSTAELVVEINADELNTAINEAYRKNRGRISVPGFRKGKAPRGVIERMYGASVFHSDAIEVILPVVLRFMLKEAGLKFTGTPQMTDVDFKDGEGGVDITFFAALVPEVTLGEYKGLSAPKPDAVVPEDEVDKEVDTIRNRNSRMEKVIRPANNGDTVIIDYEGFTGGERFEGGTAEGSELELGSGMFIPGFEEKILGMSAGDECEIDLVFPEDYSEPMAGKPAVFKVKVNEVREKQLPELDDEFAKDVSEFDTLDEYKADIRERLRSIKQADADAAFENSLMEIIADTMDADIPDDMIERQMDDSLQSFMNQFAAYGMDPSSYMKSMNTTPGAIRENMRDSSERKLRVMLALLKIAELEGIEISDAEIEDEYTDMAARYGMEIVKIKESVKEEDVVNDMKMRKAVKIVVDSAIADNSESEEKI